MLALLIENLADVEWRLPGHTVADIALDGAPKAARDGSILLKLEALTIAD